LVPLIGFFLVQKLEKVGDYLGPHCIISDFS
jgi:hypothetical protein